MRVRLVKGAFNVGKVINIPGGTPPSVKFREPAHKVVNRFCFGYACVQEPADL
jgi:hypothetical protein